MCDECENELYGLYGYSYEIDGLQPVNYMQILGIGVGYIGTSILDNQVVAYAAKQKEGTLKKTLQNSYARGGAYCGLGWAANALVPEPFVKDAGKGAIVFGAKMILAKLMPKMGISGPDSVVNIGNPDTTLRIEQTTQNVRERSLQTMLNYDNGITDSRLTEVVMTPNASKQTVVVDY